MKAKCLILKDSQGCLGGYFLQEESKLVFKSRKGKMDGCQIICVDDSGRRHILTVKDEWNEIPFSETDAQIEAVYGLKENELIWTSGEAAKRAYEADQAVRREQTDADARQTMADAPTGGLPEREIERNPKQAISQLRWPPPPCMPGARYEQGLWRTNDDRLSQR